MRRRLAYGVVVLSAVLGVGLVAPGAAAAAPAEPRIVVKDGVTQSAFSADEAVKETVRVLSDMDSDGDGKLDRIVARVMRPKETDVGLKVASIVTASPYWTSADPAALNQKRAQQRGKVVDPIVGPSSYWTGWMYGEFVPRGYAVLEVEIAGTGKSDGCLGMGGVEDERSVAAVVDWLNGRTTASYDDGTPAVASWSTGSVGMYGLSYDGKLAIQQAATGIPGLKTIVPMGAVSSWYDYTRAQGIGYSLWSTRYLEGFTSRRSNSNALTACKAKYRQIGDQESAENWDYTPFFAERNYRNRTDKVQASVFLVHGLQDDNVKTTQFARYWEQLVAHNVPRKLYLHNGGHSDPFSYAPDVLGRWMDHWLYGLDNDIMDEPEVTVSRPGATRTTDEVWPAADATEKSLYFGPAANGGAGSLTRSPVQGSQQFTNSSAVAQSTMLSNPGTAQDYRLAYLSPALASDHRMSGAGRVEVTFTANTTSTPLTALLMRYTNGGAGKVVARGSLDAKNRNSLTTGTPLVPGQQATGTILLEPQDYIFPAGSQIGVIVTGNLNDFVHSDPDAGQVSVALGASRAVLPMVGDPLPTAGCADAAWNDSSIYNTNDVVSHGGHRWRAQWWTQNQEPGTTGQWGVWVDLGTC